MIQVGSEIKKRSFVSSLRQGYIFRLKGSKPFESGAYHVFIVLNHDPVSDRVLLLVNGTSKVGKALDLMQRNPNIQNETMIYFPAGKYPFFTKDTAVNCNNVMQLDVRGLDFGTENVKTIESGTLDKGDIDRVICGVLKSRSVPEFIKAKVRKPSEVSGKDSSPVN